MAARQQISSKEILTRMFGEDALDILTGTPITGEEVEFHDSPKIVLPKGTSFEKAYSILERLQEEAETPTSFDRKFLYRANDGAYATFMVIKEMYGMLLGKATWFRPAEQRTIAIGPNETIQVPWGQIEIPTMPGMAILLCDQHADRDYGPIFEVHATGPRKYKAQMDELYARIEQFLKEHSIYRGKAVAGAIDAEFLDLAKFDPSKIVFSDEATAQIEGLIHTPIRYTQALRDKKLSLKRSALLEGPYGTGKTSEGMILAGVAVENGWTFISARPGRDKVEDVLRMARLYQPAVVFVEDIDGETSSGEGEDVTKFLDAFDGITAKGGEIIAVMTTNHLESIHKGMLRPGRLDAVVHIGTLDRGGVERLIKALVLPKELDAKVDFDKVALAMEGFYPAFVSETVTRAITVAIGRTEGKGEYVITTSDLITAAESLHLQLQQLEQAGEGEKRPTINIAFGDLVKKAVGDLRVVDQKMGISAEILELEPAK